MINGHEKLSKVLLDVPHQADGRVFLVICIFCVGWMLINIFPTDASIASGKWIAIWALLPVLEFIVYARARQLIDGDTTLGNSLRILFLIVMPVVLAYFNIKEI